MRLTIRPPLQKGLPAASCEYVMRGALRWAARDDCHVQFFKRGTLRRVTYLRLDARYQFINTWDRLQAWGRRDREIETHDFCHCHDRTPRHHSCGRRKSGQILRTLGLERSVLANPDGCLRGEFCRYSNCGSRTRNLRDATSRTRYARIICASQEIAIKRES
jgi:hypothetical protein